VTATESAEEVAGEMGPWQIARENGMDPRATVTDIAAEWAARCEPHDDEARQEVESGALAGFVHYLADGPA
jgi:hypothetical protein